MILQTLLLGFALSDVPLDELAMPGWFTTSYESVVFEAWGMLEIDVTGRSLHRVRWDMRHEGSWRNYLKARKDLARTPVPHGVT